MYLHTRSQTNTYQINWRTNTGVNNHFLLASKAYNKVPENSCNVSNWRPQTGGFVEPNSHL